MDSMNKGGFTSCPHFLDGTNYGYWKERMNAFIKSIDEKAWRSVLQGWKKLTKTNAKGKNFSNNEAD